MWVPSAAYLPLAKAIRDQVAGQVLIFHGTRMTDAATAVHAVTSGSVDMVGMTRAFIADPHHVAKLTDGDEESIRPCVGAGYCVDRVIRGLDALCINNVATSREAAIPHVVPPALGLPKTVVVVGGGPAGMEAARISALRGRKVVLLEAAGELGGQLLLASRATWRREMAGITRWLNRQMEILGVDVRCDVYAGAAEVLSEAPDVAIIATGALPKVGDFEDTDLADTTWDVLSGQVGCAEDVLLFDENGAVPGLSCAEVAASRGSRVRIVTPDREIGRELGGTNLGAHLNELFEHDVAMVTDARLVSVTLAENKLVATVVNTYTGRPTEYRVDQVIGENGTVPNDELYGELKPLSRDLGETDLRAAAEVQPQTIAANPEGRFMLVKVGDAWASRNSHAAMLDAARIAHVT